MRKKERRKENKIMGRSKEKTEWKKGKYKKGKWLKGEI